jgi:hypothetical protein
MAGFSIQRREYCRVRVHGFVPKGDVDATAYILSLHARAPWHGDTRFLAVCLDGHAFALILEYDETVCVRARVGDSWGKNLDRVNDCVFELCIVSTPDETACDVVAEWVHQRVLCLEEEFSVSEARAVPPRSALPLQDGVDEASAVDIAEFKYCHHCMISRKRCRGQ